MAVVAGDINLKKRHLIAAIRLQFCKLQNKTKLLIEQQLNKYKIYALIKHTTYKLTFAIKLIDLICDLFLGIKIALKSLYCNGVSLKLIALQNSSKRTWQFEMLA